MRRTLAIAFVLAMLAGAVVASVATAAPPDRSSTLRPWGQGRVARTAGPTAAPGTPKGATRPVVLGQEADSSIIDAAPAGDSPGDQILFTDTPLDQAGRFAVTGGTGQFKKARGQLHETFLPNGQFRFAFTLYL
jgi:hypothetical protein